MSTFYYKICVILLSLGVAPLVFADDYDDQAYQDQLRQQRGVQQAQEINQVIVPIVESLFNKNKRHTDVYIVTPPAYYYGTGLNNNPNYQTLPPGGCYHLREGGGIQQIPCGVYGPAY